MDPVPSTRIVGGGVPREMEIWGHRSRLMRHHPSRTTNPRERLARCPHNGWDQRRDAWCGRVKILFHPGDQAACTVQVGLDTRRDAGRTQETGQLLLSVTRLAEIIHHKVECRAIGNRGVQLAGRDVQRFRRLAQRSRPGMSFILFVDMVFEIAGNPFKKTGIPRQDGRADMVRTGGCCGHG